MADRTAASYPNWIEVDSVELPSPPKGATRASECWRGDSLPARNILAYVRRTKTQYFKDVLQTWTLDRAAFRLPSASPEGIECLNTQWPVGRRK